MDINAIVSQVLALDSVKQTTSWNTEAVLHLSFEVAVLVKQVGDSSKPENIALLVQVLDAVIDALKAKESSSLDQEKSTESAKKWDLLKTVVHTTVPVVFSHTSHLDVVKSVSKLFSCCSGSSVLKQVDAVVADVETVVKSDAADAGKSVEEKLVDELKPTQTV